MLTRLSDRPVLRTPLVSAGPFRASRLRLGPPGGERSRQGDRGLGIHPSAECLFVRVFVRAEGVDERLFEVSLELTESRSAGGGGVVQLVDCALEPRGRSRVGRIGCERESCERKRQMDGGRTVCGEDEIERFRKSLSRLGAATEPEDGEAE